MLPEMLAVMAIVTQDQAALRSAPRDSAQQQAVLWQGEALEVRGEKLGFLQVYDHRLERGGYIRAAQVRTTQLKPTDAPELLSVIRFLRDTPGAEALGIGYTAAYLKAAPAEAIGPEAFDALGSMADRLARRASGRHSKTDDTTIAAHLEVAASYGITISSQEREGRVQLCYNGEAFRRVLALAATEEQKARAALALTRPDCINPDMPPVERYGFDTWRADVLDRVDVSKLPEFQKNRIRLRQAGVWSSLAYERTRRGENTAQASANHALQALAGINKNELAEEDLRDYTDAAVRVGASRWAGNTVPTGGGKFTIELSTGQPGETCVNLINAGSKSPKEKHVFLQRCTYGLVWPASVSVNPQGTALALAVQPLDTWRELWLFRQTASGWVVDVLPPATNPDLGYLEFAGWVPGGSQMLAVREAKVDGRFIRKFEIINLGTLETSKQADSPQSLSLFYRWQSPLWKNGTVSIR